jgi:hypothetical protein
LSNGINVILPVQPSRKKYFCFHPTQIISLSCASRLLYEGRFAIVTNVGGGMRWTPDVPTTNGA